MGDDTETPPKPAPVSWVQALAIVGLVGVTVFDLTAPGDPVPWHFHVALIAIALGADPQALWSLIRGK